jgi:hypothetical protein
METVMGSKTTPDAEFYTCIYFEAGLSKQVVTPKRVIWKGGIKMDFGEILTASVVWWLEFLATDPEVRVRFPTLPDFPSSSRSATESTQPREHN